MKKAILRVVLGILLIGALALIIFRQINAYRLNYISPDALGNTAGNVMNRGLFCELGDNVYFSNGYDNGALYQLHTPDGSVKKLIKHNVYGITAAGHSLFFCVLVENFASDGVDSFIRKAGIYRTQLDGTNSKCLNKNAGVTLQLAGPTLYYQQLTGKGTILVKQDIRTKNRVTLSSEDEVILPASIANDTMYYHSPSNNHYLYTLDLNTDEKNPLWNQSVWNPIYDNGYLYFISMDGNYQLCRRRIDSDQVELLTRDSVDSYNVYQDMIYYCTSKGKEPAIKRMKTNGSSLEVVRYGVFNNINITSEYTYYTPYDRAYPIYRQRTFGPILEEEFDAAKQAALQGSLEN